MEPQDPVEALVMDAIANDYEDLDMVRNESIKFGALRNIYPTHEEILAALIRLIDKDFAKAYLITPVSMKEIQGQPSRQEFENCYFLLTEKGRSAIRYDELGD